ncbi:unnamed protein product [Auanema sp. JU1783]|nr:unnamed protein product [Auanema sp. JU1783]
MRRKPSFLFAPYRVMGIVCTDVKPAFCTALSKNKMTSLYCPIDNSVHHYNATKLRTVAVSKSLPNVITALAVEPTGIYAAAGKEIYFMKFCRTVDKTFTVNHVTKNMMIFGDQLVIIDQENGINIIEKENGSEILYLEGSPEFEITALVHPATYLNKIVVGSSNGKLRIINIKTGKVIHEFKPVDSPVTIIEQSPIVDVLAIGFANGKVILYDIRSAELICSFKHDSAITAIGFRTDGEPFLTTGDLNGNIAVWDLEKRELIGKIANVHKKSITRLHFLPSEPIMISTSADNSIRTWVLDGMDGMPRQLNLLEGHSDPITALNFSNKEEIVSASLDGSVRKSNVANPTMRQKLGNAGIMSRAQAKLKKRALDTILLEPVVEIAFGWCREAAWDNILCRHRDTLLVTTWTSRKNSQGTHKIAHKRFTEVPSLFDAVATAVAISPCGNFGYIGYSTGHIDQYNIQSARFIQTFIDPSYKNSEDTVALKGHNAAITCISVDTRGDEIVTGCKSGELKFWEVSSGKLSTIMKSKLSIQSSSQCPTSSLIAVACHKKNSKGSSVSIIDTICRKIVRTFNLPGALPSSVTFSSDGRWLLTADDTGLIRVWELATSQLIDVILSERKCVGMSFNPTGEFLATVHENDNAIYIWANQILFSSFVSVKALPLDFKPTWPDSSVDCRTLDLYSSDEDEEEMSIEVSSNFDKGLVSFSGLSTARWANLSDLSLIKERNKPIEAPKKPKQAPFFLTAAPTLEGFEFDIAEEDEEEKRKTVQAKRSLLEIESSFSAALRNVSDDSKYLELFAKLKDMSISTIDFQIRSLPANVLPNFFRMILEVLKTNQDFDLAQSYMGAAIRIHRNSLWSAGDESLTKVLEELSLEQEKEWTPYEEILTNNASVVQWVKNALI